MADASLNLKRKKRGSNSSTSDNELKSPEEKRARDKALNVELALSSGVTLCVTLCVTCYVINMHARCPYKTHPRLFKQDVK